jgi:glycogen operon protein
MFTRQHARAAGDQGSQSGIRMMVSKGSPLPMGVHQLEDGVNFTLFSRHATAVSLLLYLKVDDDVPAQTVALDPAMHRTGDIWHVCLPDVQAGMAYTWRVDGPWAPEQGHRFRPDRSLLDPYATAVYLPASGQGKKNLVMAHHFEWGGDVKPRHPWSSMVIYELHTRGFTIDPSSGVRYRGSFLGLIEKIPHLKSLGITAIELMPIQAFCPELISAVNPETGEKLRNYWGYDTVAFFAPHPGYGSGSHPGCEVEEFKRMVKAMHEAGIEVLLDVVFNHTAEGNEHGPTLSFRGLDNRIFYLLEEDRSFYRNYSGCGNTMNCNHPVVRNYILDCLRYWAVEMHVDGFRFDLASILGRDQSGSLIANPPLIEQIAEDPILRDVKLIAEAWDAAGAYMVGRFSGDRWSEWNGIYRDDIRRYWRGDAGMAGALASRLCGSADIYQHSGKAPIHSINFVTCHDGFTLHDLVSYGLKHNEANGEGNRDGANDNYSANYGHEGPGADPALVRLRLRQMKNLMATLLLSRGIPMLLAGDELCRTQGGNNNAYCQDNATSWLNWSVSALQKEFMQFVRGMLALRASLPVLSCEEFYQEGDLQWFDHLGQYPDWHEGHGAIACMIRTDCAGTRPAQLGLCLLFNPSNGPVEFPLPPTPDGGRWALAVDTGQGRGRDVVDLKHLRALGSPLAITLMDHSLVVLVES